VGRHGSCYPGLAEPEADAGAVDGAAGEVGVAVFFGGEVVGVVGGGAEVDADEVPDGGGAAVEDDGCPVAPVVLCDVVALGGAVVGAGVVVGAGAGDTWLVVGRGCGACGLLSPWAWGSMNRPSPSPATASTEPAAFRAVRTRLWV
jgi:hypothetical protein